MKFYEAVIGPANDCTYAEALARRVILCIDAEEAAFVDFSQCDRMTPSFADVLWMTLAHAHPILTLKKRALFSNRNENVRAAMDAAERRYLDGIRLSTQRK
jgi:hypothetical protein